MIIYGGGTFTGNPTAKVFTDVWVLANANGTGATPTWAKLSVMGPLPDGRNQHTAVYDATNNRMIVYGGLAFEGILYSVWVLSGANGCDLQSVIHHAGALYVNCSSLAQVKLGQSSRRPPNRCIYRATVYRACVA